ncbi:hypothetical protein HK099_007328 [Clydaea vesicula]|uniref:Uncharacterized protein n=1 Tax=Clydaea vesicula TaxID=447962 RepID=A0AAD5XZB5_9FUNG|nr:hypothetical protein HK099_007328 [Clydaea vesicula]KAJ3396362.1 hypothetical protein HDU92_003204 [Lobulomyces angularis]
MQQVPQVSKVQDNTLPPKELSDRKQQKRNSIFGFKKQSASSATLSTDVPEGTLVDDEKQKKKRFSIFQKKPQTENLSTETNAAPISTSAVDENSHEETGKVGEAEGNSVEEIKTEENAMKKIFNRFSTKKAVDNSVPPSTSNDNAVHEIAKESELKDFDLKKTEPRDNEAMDGTKGIKSSDTESKDIKEPKAEAKDIEPNTSTTIINNIEQTKQKNTEPSHFKLLLKKFTTKREKPSVSTKENVVAEELQSDDETEVPPNSPTTAENNESDEKRFQLKDFLRKLSLKKNQQSKEVKPVGETKKDDEAMEVSEAVASAAAPLVVSGDSKVETVI